MQQGHKRQTTGVKMGWSATYLLIQVIAGILGGYAAAAAAHEHSFGALGHGIAGAAGGALSGYFLQTYAGTIVNATGAANEVEPVTQWILQSLTGLAAGAILTLAVGFAKHGLDQSRAGKN
jgi:hypothetical protein